MRGHLMIRFRFFKTSLHPFVFISYCVQSLAGFLNEDCPRLMQSSRIISLSFVYAFYFQVINRILCVTCYKDDLGDWANSKVCSSHACSWSGVFFFCVFNGPEIPLGDQE